MDEIKLAVGEGREITLTLKEKRDVRWAIKAAFKSMSRLLDGVSGEAALKLKREASEDINEWWRVLKGEKDATLPNPRTTIIQVAVVKLAKRNADLAARMAAMVLEVD